MLSNFIIHIPSYLYPGGNRLGGMSFKRRFMIDGFELPQQLVAGGGEGDDEGHGELMPKKKGESNLELGIKFHDGH